MTDNQHIHKIATIIALTSIITALSTGFILFSFILVYYICKKITSEEQKMLATNNPAIESGDSATDDPVTNDLKSNSLTKNIHLQKLKSMRIFVKDEPGSLQKALKLFKVSRVTVAMYA